MSASDPSTHSYFASLLEQSRKLRENTDAADLPPIQLGLGEIERRAKELKKSRPGARKDTRAHYLLAAGGVNAEEALRHLEAFDTQAPYEAAPPPVDTDIESYLNSRKEQNILSSIEDGMQRTSRDFDAFVAKNVTMEWDKQKARIFEHFGLYPKLEGADGEGANVFSASTFGRSIHGAKAGKGSTFGTGSIWARAVGSSVLGKPVQAAAGGLFADVDPSRQLTTSRPVQIRQQNYAGILRKLNEARVAGSPFPILKQLEDVTSNSGGDVLTVQLRDSWRMLQHITGEDPEGNPFDNGPRERHFAKLHMNVKPDSPEAAPLKKMITSGSRQYLEKLFLRHVEETIEKHPLHAKLGGIPTLAHKFKAYFNVKAATNTWNEKHFDLNPDNVPVWAIVFYMIRAGKVQDAAAYVKEHHQFFQKVDRSFHLYISAYAKDPERRVPRNLADRIQVEYTQSLRDAENVDMFRIALYKVIGRCDLAKRSLSEVMPTAEDWMWLQLVLTRESERAGEPAHEVFQLVDLQKSVLQFGAKHFSSKGSNVGLYFQMLLMAGLFEHAVQYLYSFQSVDAVHFAIALTYYGLLGVASSQGQRADSNLLVTGSHGDYQINFARMIGQYVRDYRSASIEDAVDYLCMICLNGDLSPPDGHTQLTLCHEALRELALESREFTKLLGDMKADGTREKGAIEKRMKLIKIADQQEFLRTITEQAAAQADDDGRVSDAVLLYHLAEDYNTVVQVLNRSISDWIASEDPTQLTSQPTGGQHQADAQQSITEFEDPAELGKHMGQLYWNMANMYRQISPRNREALMVLLKIAEAKRMYLVQDYEACLSQIESLDIIPMEPRVEVGAIRKTAQNFGNLHDMVARNVGMLLKLSVECCHQLAKKLKDSPFLDATKMQKLQEYRARVKCAMIYAGMVQYKLPTHVYEFIAHRDENM
ncbi:Nup93/Nic96-domain-containing protein [Kalaharituber pfeilii]|nr:Nup93/Nic96-domain-containing protein [Kalaharituber pfeilii]